MINGYANDAASPRMAPPPASSAPTSRPQWMGPVRGGYAGTYSRPAPLHRAEAGGQIEPPCLRCPYYQSACNMGGSSGTGERHRVSAQGHSHGADVDRRHNSAARPDREETRFDSVADAKVLARYARMKTAHHVLRALRLTRAPRTAFALLVAAGVLWGFQLGERLVGL